MSNSIKKQKTKTFYQLETNLAWAIEKIKSCGFTHIKAEFEGDLDRGDDCGHDEDCYECEGSGYFPCDECENGEVLIDVEQDVYDTCDHCGGSCEICCGVCDGEGTIYNDGSDFDDYYCEEYMLETLEPDEREAIAYRSFYYDGSVDSEFTVTVPIENISTLVKFAKRFKSLGDDAIGNGVRTDGAGMHLSLMSSGNINSCTLNRDKLRNFKKSMVKLLPSLYFLASCSHDSRGLQYRPPIISEDKYSAISTARGILEYRIFETCYDKPEALYDFVIVMANTLQFYDNRYKPVDINFKGDLPIKEGFGISRLYYTNNHLRVLKEGLKILKPQYKSMKQILKDRNFNITPSKIKEILEKKKLDWLQEYPELKKRGEEDIERICRNVADMDFRGVLEITKEQYLEQEIKAHKEYNKHLYYESAKEYVNNKLNSYLNGSGSHWVINY